MFDGQSGLWTWECDDRQLEFDEGEEVRVRVQAVNFRPVPTRADMKARPTPPPPLFAHARLAILLLLHASTLCSCS